MGRLQNLAKTWTVIIVISSLSILSVYPVSALFPTPEFTVEYKDNSYGIPSSSMLDPATGKNITKPAQYVQNKTIHIIVKNQPVSSSESVLYVIHVKNHSENTWTYFTAAFADKQLRYTVLIYALKGNNATSRFNEYFNFSSGDTIDIQMYAKLFLYLPNDGHIQSGFNQEIDKSYWSNNQTITIPYFEEPNPTPTSTIFCFAILFPLLVDAILITCVILISVSIFLIMILWKRRQQLKAYN
jgi:hypothetical protein